METTPSSSEGATPQTGSPATGTPATASATQQAATPTVEELLKEIESLKHTHGNAKEELDRHRKKLSAYEKKEADEVAARKAAEEAQLSEIERVKKQHSELQAQHADYMRTMQERVVRYEVERHAGKLNFIHPELAARLLDWSELEFSEDGTPTNAEKLLEKLLKTAPELAHQPAQTTPTQPQSANNAPVGSGRPALPAMNPGRTQIVAPGSQTPGRIPRLSDAGVFVPPGTPSRYQP